MPRAAISCPSPNHDARPPGMSVDMLIVHYTGMRTADEALARLCDPAAKVSAHYTIGRDGRIFAHVPEERRAWHAGVSFWAGRTNINAHSIGIELVNPGHEFGYVAFAEEQVAALADLARGILRRHPIAARHVLGHSDVAPGRKMDPGELFPWARLAGEGIGVWPSGPAACAPVEDFAANLSRYGYGTPPQTEAALGDVISAFQRHFRPSCVDGIADGECAGLLARLLDG